MDQTQVKPSYLTEEMSTSEVARREQQIKNLELHCRFMMKDVSDENSHRQLRGQGSGIGMLLQSYADDLVFIQLEDVTLLSNSY